ncbi:MAG: hypothetical protein LBP93_00480 [Treponema sp.]|jgi:hypothetical protein|nr:hypothetical protein [Treponema sp.]
MDKDAPPPGEQRQPDREPVFYYSRSRRLERASDAVRAMNDPAPQKRPGILRPLVATKSLTFLFLSIVIIVVAFIIISVVSSPEDTSKILGGNTVAVSALKFQGSTYLVIKKTMGEGDVYTGTVDLAVSIALPPEDEKTGAEAPISTHRIFFSLEPEEEYRLAVPFEAPRLIILMQGGNELIRLSVRPE